MTLKNDRLLICKRCDFRGHDPVKKALDEVTAGMLDAGFVMDYNNNDWSPRLNTDQAKFYAVGRMLDATENLKLIYNLNKLGMRHTTKGWTKILLFKPGTKGYHGAADYTNNEFHLEDTGTPGTYSHEFHHMIEDFIGGKWARALKYAVTVRADFTGIKRSLEEHDELWTQDPANIDDLIVTQEKFDDFNNKLAILEELNNNSTDNFKHVSDRLMARVQTLPLRFTEYKYVAQALNARYSGRNALQKGADVLRGPPFGLAWVSSMEADQNYKRDYWFSFVELTARTMEFYIANKLAAMGIHDRFLTNPTRVIGSDSKTIVYHDDIYEQRPFPNIPGEENYHMNYFQNWIANLDNNNGSYELVDSSISPMNMWSMPGDDQALSDYVTKMKEVQQKINNR